MKEQLTLNNSGTFQVIVNTKTGKFYRGKYNPETDRYSDYTWTDQVRLCDHIPKNGGESYIRSLREFNNLTEEVVIKTYQLQYVEII